jgi:hypothetical protein
MYDTDGTQLRDRGKYWSILYTYTVQLIFLNKLHFLLHIGYYYLCDGGYPKLPLKCPGVGPYQQKWSSHLESTRKVIERTFGSITQRIGYLVNPIPIQEAHWGI